MQLHGLPGFDSMIERQGNDYVIPTSVMMIPPPLIDFCCFFANILTTLQASILRCITKNFVIKRCTQCIAKSRKK